MDGYFYIDEPRSGAMNMAIDQRLVELADQYGCALLRVYQWEKPTLSLGYFQSIAERQSHVESLAIDCVRRSSGGGAIVHHHDWTYAVALPGERNRTGAATELYDCVHDSLVSWLRQLGWDAAKWNAAKWNAAKWETGSENTTASAPRIGGCQANANCRDFLCFNRRSSGDIVVAGQKQDALNISGQKVLGSAQRRFGRAILQHGSLLVRTSPHAPSLTGLLDLATDAALLHKVLASPGVDFAAPVDVAGIGKQLAMRITDGISVRFGVNFAKLNLRSLIWDQLRHVVSDRFADMTWTAKR